MAVVIDLCEEALPGMSASPARAVLLSPSLQTRRKRQSDPLLKSQAKVLCVDLSCESDPEVLSLLESRAQRRSSILHGAHVPGRCHCRRPKHNSLSLLSHLRLLSCRTALYAWTRSQLPTASLSQLVDIAFTSLVQEPLS